MRHVVKEGGLQYAQLCGSESPDYCSELSIPYWKVINLHSAADYDCMPPYTAAAAFCAGRGRQRAGRHRSDVGLGACKRSAPRDRPCSYRGRPFTGLTLAPPFQTSKALGSRCEPAVWKPAGQKTRTRLRHSSVEPKTVHHQVMGNPETTRGVNARVASRNAARSLRLCTVSVRNESASTPKRKTTPHVGGSVA